MFDEQSARLFIVEDEALIAMELKERLSALKYTVCGVAARGETALAQIEEAQPDIVLMDNRLAGELDGVETVELMREFSDAAVIMLSAYSDDELLERANEAGIASFLVKPIRERELHAAIQTALYKAHMERALLDARVHVDEQRRLNQSTLNAIAARIAVVAEDGCIVATNSSWKRFAEDNDFDWQTGHEGSNYLEGCELETGECQEEALTVAKSIREVIAGECSENFLEYSCQCDGRERYFYCHITSFSVSGALRVVVAHDDITDVHDARNRLAIEEHVFESLASSSPVGIYRINPEGQCVYFNDRACELTDLTPKAALGLGWMATVHPDDRLRVDAIRKEVLSGASFPRTEYRILRKDGRVNWVMSQSAVIPDLHGVNAGFVGTLSDITERKRTELAMEVISTELVALEGKEFYETALHRLCELLEVELAFATRLDVKANEFQTIAFVENGESQSGFKESASTIPCSIVLGGESLLVETGLSERFPDNPFLKQRGIESYAGEPMVDRANGCIGHLCVLSHRPFRDPGAVGMTLRLFSVAMGAALERERAAKRYETLFEFSPSGLVMASSDGRIVLMNRQAERIFGWGRGEATGELIEVLVPEANREGHIGSRTAYMQLDECEQQSLDRPRQIGLRKDGTTFPVEISLAPIESPDGPLFAASVRDLTAQQALERKVAHSQKMEAVGELAGGIAHDFNNLLTAINGFAHLLASRLEADSKEEEMVQEILRAGGRASSLTRELLTFSRKQEEQQCLMGLNEVITGAEKMIHYLLGHHIELVLELESDVGLILADPAQVEQVVVNLALNARDAMPRGGKLTVSSKLIVLGDSEAAEFDGLEPGPHCVFEVADTGSGIKEEVLAHIFEPFFTTKGRIQGTGLGLAVVYGIVRQGRGTINVVSEVGKGTTFAVYFPQVDSELVPSGDEGWAEDYSSVAKGTVLVVEDEPAVLVLTQSVLEDAGYSVLSATTGEEALEILESSTVAIDILLTDVLLPGVDGVRVAEVAKVARSEVRVLYMSGYSPEKIVGPGGRCQDGAFLSKPFSPPQLLEALAGLLI